MTQRLFFVPVIPDFLTGPGRYNQRPDLTSFLPNCQGFYFYVVMQFQKANFYLFIRSGRGASLSQRDCLNLTIVSNRNLIIHFFEYKPWKVNFRRSLMRKLKFFRTALRYWNYKEKNELYCKLLASFPICERGKGRFLTISV